MAWESLQIRWGPIALAENPVRRILAREKNRCQGRRFPTRSGVAVIGSLDWT